MEDTFETKFSEFVLTEKTNEKEVSDIFKDKIETFKSFFDIQLELFKIHFGGYSDPYYFIEEYERVVLQSFIKTSYLLYSALKLTIKGNFGASNILLRQIFEFLILGKYVSLTKNEVIAKHWLDGRQFTVYDKIIKSLDQPQKKNFHDFWVMLCNVSHATTVSYQIELKASKNSPQISASFALILLLQRCNYHLLTSCLLNKRLIYRSEFYGDFKTKNSNLKAEARILKSKISALLSSDGNALIKDYECKWEFRK